MEKLRTETLCIQAGYTPGNGEPRQIPIIQSTTFKYSTSEDMGKLFDLEAEGYFYSRLANPTCDAVAAKICALEGGSAAMLTGSGMAAVFLALANIVSALAWFLLNGFVSVYLKVSSFIVSLCVMYMCRGILNTVCAKQKFSVPVYMYSFDSVPIKLSVLVVSFIVCYLLFEKSPVGKANKAIGGNPVAARLSGIHTERTRMLAYVISGITVGVSAFILMARAGSVSTSTGQGMEMNVVTALVLGGVPLSGGSRVKMTGSLVGSFSVIILRNGLIILGVNERVVEGIQGIVLLLLVLLTYVKNKDGIEN